MLPIPSVHTLPESTCPLAWHGGVRHTPSWRHYAGIIALDRAGVHTLLRGAGLPLAELRHMGATTHVLSERGSYVHAEEAVPLFGRILWDLVYGDRCGFVFGLLGPDEQAEVRAMGRAVVDAWFHS